MVGRWGTATALLRCTAVLQGCVGVCHHDPGPMRIRNFPPTYTSSAKRQEPEDDGLRRASFCEMATAGEQAHERKDQSNLGVARNGVRTSTAASRTAAPSEWACSGPSPVLVSLSSPRASRRPPPATSSSCWPFRSQTRRSPWWWWAGREPARQVPPLEAGAVCAAACLLRCGSAAARW